MKTKREAKFRSAREFCTQVDVGISYPQYSRYEAGQQLPSLEQALSLCRLFGVSSTETLLEWSRAQVSDGEMRKEVEALLENARAALPIVLPSEVRPSPAPAQGQGIFNEAAVPLDDVVVFNRLHLRVFSSDARYRDIFTYINSFAPQAIDAGEIAAALRCSREDAEKMLETLNDLGVIVAEKEGPRSSYRASKRVFYFPDDEDFFEMRNLNLRHNATSILERLTHKDISERRAYRGLITRELTEQQLQLVVEHLDQLIGKVVALPETSNPEKIYSLCVLLGQRFSK